MSTLTNIEKRKLERILGMSTGYVLDFSNRTFFEFVTDSTSRDIYDARYDGFGSSKANRLRGFWATEGNHNVGKLLDDLLDYARDIGSVAPRDEVLLADCRRIAARLLRESPVPELDALESITSERDFETIAKAIRDAIDKNQPEAGLDRLHTLVIKYVRSLCLARGLTVGRDKPLHSLFGEYVGALRKSGLIESAMTERILRVNISVMEAFNEVRNDQSLAHDNPILNYEEALLIFNHVTALVRFLRGLENRIRAPKHTSTVRSEFDEIPF
jgi:abortive infection Abi-like protein